MLADPSPRVAFSNADIIFEMSAHQLVVYTAAAQLVPGIVADRIQHREMGLSGDAHGLLDEALIPQGCQSLQDPAGII